MGYRSTLISEHYGADLPGWFAEKYKDNIAILDGTLIASKREFKIYTNDLFYDFQKALLETGILGNDLSVCLIVMGEDTSITKVVISADSVKFYWMDEGIEANHVYLG